GRRAAADRARPPAAGRLEQGTLLHHPLPPRPALGVPDAGAAAAVRPLVLGGGAGLRHPRRRAGEGALMNGLPLFAQGIDLAANAVAVVCAVAVISFLSG